MAMSVHTNENLYNFEPSNKIAGPTLVTEFKDDIPSAIAEFKEKVSPYNSKLIQAEVMAFEWMINYLPTCILRGDE